jgi:hypothetical protein
MKTNYSNMYFMKYILFICMSKNENSKPKEYYAQLIIFSNQIHHIWIIYNNQIKQNYEKNYKTKWIKHQNKFLLFSISQKKTIIHAIEMN